MSHITEIKVRFTDMDSLSEAAARLGGRLLLGQTTHRTFGRFVGDSEEGRRFVAERGEAAIGKCDHAIRLNSYKDGEYEVGVVKAQDGVGFALVFDAWGSGHKLVEAFGAGLNRLRQEYAAAVASRKAKQKLVPKGFRLTREDLPTGQVRLRLRRA